MTAPDDPFRTPPPGSRPGDDPAGRPVDPYGSTGGTGGSQQYGSQPYGGPAFGEPRRAPRNGLGIAALVVGILALLTGPFLIGGALGIAAVVLGVMGRGRVKRGEATNGGMALAGIVLGVLGILLSALAVLGLVTLFSSDSVTTFAECIENAGNDAAAQAQCQADFEDQVVGG